MIIDNTNPSAKVRNEYLSLIGDFSNKGKVAIPTGSYLVLCDKRLETHAILFEENKELVSHLNIFRERKTHKKRLPKIAYAMFNKNFEEPIPFSDIENGEEGLDNIHRMFPFNGSNLEGLDKVYFDQISE